MNDSRILHYWKSIIRKLEANGFIAYIYVSVFLVPFLSSINVGTGIQTQKDLGLDSTNIIVSFMYWFPFLLFWQNTTKK